ncbi:MAG TPA: diaminopimelate decarboxylase [Bacteroidales bacterium]|nr:diaminopimelate decarboxylase [Bacteroidales bacterium]
MKLAHNRYLIDGIDAVELVEKYGSPVYVYQTAKMKQQYDKMLQAFKDIRVRINFACKALNNINVLRFFKNIGTGLDAVSIQEVELGLKAGFKPQDIIFTPNCVSIEEILEGVKAGVKINIDNISILEQFGNLFGNTVPVCIRINPHILGGGHDKISTGHIDSKFGISIYQLPHVHRVVEATGLKVEGLHMHTGSDILDVEVFLRGTDIMLDVARSFPDLVYIDFGSGFKVAYKPDDYFTDMDTLGRDLTKRFKKFCKEYGRELTLVFEPGKFLVSEAGYFFARVNVVKQTLSTVFAGVDTGLNHLIRPMFYDAYHQIINVSNPKGKQRIYTVVGYICETDTFGWNRKINDIREGDYLVFLNAGAYCFTMASNYNSRLRPPEVLIHEGKDYLIRHRETLEDVLRNQVILDL